MNKNSTLSHSTITILQWNVSASTTKGMVLVLASNKEIDAEDRLQLGIIGDL